jgi:hypothetical protein
MHKRIELNRQEIANSLRIIRDLSRRLCSKVITDSLESVGVRVLELNYILDKTFLLVDNRQRQRINDEWKRRIDYQHSLRINAKSLVSAERSLKERLDTEESNRIKKLNEENERRLRMQRKVAEEMERKEILFVASVKRDELIAEINSLKSKQQHMELKQRVAMFDRLRKAAGKL